MMLHCPFCHIHFPAEAFTQDDSARTLMSLMRTMPPSLFPYLGLFRSETRPLSWRRALQLTNDLVDLNVDIVLLEVALQETIEALRGKSGPPLKNHNYLKRVLESMGTCQTAIRAGLPAKTINRAPVSKTEEAMTELEEWARG